MIKSVVREHHWSPRIVGDFFIDGEDYDGLEFWYTDLVEAHKELKSKTEKKK